MTSMPTALLIPAAGKAARMGEKRNKQYILLAGRPVLAHTLQAFRSLGLFSPVLVLVAPGEEDLFRRWVRGPFFPDSEDLHVLAGGAERQQTVYEGLSALRDKGFPEDGFVCVHDGARPFITAALIQSVCAEARNLGAAVCGIPLKDTVKELNGEGLVLSTPRRETLVAVQTPQCFRFSLLWEAHQRARSSELALSDDAGLVEQLGVPVKVVPGREDNIKLTTPLDLELARVIIEGRDNTPGQDDFEDQFGAGGGLHCR